MGDTDLEKIIILQDEVKRDFLVKNSEQENIWFQILFLQVSYFLIIFEGHWTHSLNIL